MEDNKKNPYYDIKEILGQKHTYTNMEDLLKCALCPNMCRFECPSLRVTQKETYAPATKARISYHIERGYLDITDLHTAEVVYICTNCDGCKTWCPMDISVGDLLRSVRADLVDREIFIPGVKEFNDRVRSNGTAFKEDLFTADKTYSVNMENPEVFYYIGCVMAEKKPDAVSANIKILKKSGISFCTFTEERQCCGGPLYTLGFRNTVKEFAKKNLELFKRTGITTIISDCPMCAFTIENIYGELGFKHNYTVMTTEQFFKGLIQNKKIKPTEYIDLSVTYHDPCISARKRGDVESGRFILNNIPGVKIIEPFLACEETQCCGMGGVSHVHHPDLSEEMGRQRYEQLVKTGAKKIVTSCPSCEEAFMRTGGSKKVLDIGEILAQSLKD
ncbi:MAG: (Fe-S)-binding protein [Promethearchaeota archaeon]